MTFVVVGDDNVLEQVRKQLEKVVTVVRVVDISAQDFVERDLMLIKVHAPPGGRRSEIRELAEIFRGRIVDVADRGSDRRDLGPGAQDRVVHRPDAPLRHRGTGAHRTDRDGPRPENAHG